jgi:hypothetical protein
VSNATRKVQRAKPTRWQAQSQLLLEAIVRLAKRPEYADLVEDIDAELEGLGAFFGIEASRKVASA